MSKNKRKRTPNKRTGDFYNVSVMEVHGEDHEQFKKGMLDGAKDALQQFPKVIETLTNLFKETYPPQLLACFAAHSFRQ